MADSTHPLSDPERARLKAGFSAYDSSSLDSRITHVFYSTGMHPCVLSEVTRHRLIVSNSIVAWNRPKTGKAIHVPLDPEIAPWISGLLELMAFQPIHRVTLAQKVGTFGRAIGLVGLTPRGLRHDYAFRVTTARGVLVAREYTGTTTDVLFGYANRQMAERDAKNPEGLF